MNTYGDLAGWSRWSPSHFAQHPINGERPNALQLDHGSCHDPPGSILNDTCPAAANLAKARRHTSTTPPAPDDCLPVLSAAQRAPASFLQKEGEFEYKPTGEPWVEHSAAEQSPEGC